MRRPRAGARGSSVPSRTVTSRPSARHVDATSAPMKPAPTIATRGAPSRRAARSATASSRVRRTCTPSTPSVPGRRRARPPVASTTPSARHVGAVREHDAPARGVEPGRRDTEPQLQRRARRRRPGRAGRSRPRRRCRRGTPSTAAAGRRAGARRRRRAPAVRRSPRRAGPRRTGPRRRTLPRSRWSSCGLLVGLRYWGVARGSRARVLTPPRGRRARGREVSGDEPVERRR